MYSRRIKLNKKKPKLTREKPTPGSNWGPRLALIERERALAGGSGMLEDEEEEELYEIHHELVHSVKKPSTSGLGVGPATGKQQHLHHHHHHPHTNSNNGRHPEVDPVLRLGRSSSPNYIYYNYSRRTAPNANSSTQPQQMRKISCPEPTSAMRAQASANHLHSHSHNHQQRRASYVLGASSGYCSGSVTTLSNYANNDDGGNFEELTKPLTLIIPSQNKFDEYNNEKKGKKHESRHHQQRHKTREFERLRQPQETLYHDPGEEVSGNDNARKSHRGKPRHFHNPMAHMSSKKTPGILQISTKEVVQIHAPPVDPTSPPVTIEDTLTEPETLEIGAESDEVASNNNNRKYNFMKKFMPTGSSQSVTTVYVPMSRTDIATENQTKINARNMGSSKEPGDLPELGQHSDDCSASTSSSCRGSGKDQEDSLSSNFILRRKVFNHSHNREHQTNFALDSLLESDSFESVLFKPKQSGVQQQQKPEKSQVSESISQQQHMEHKNMMLKRPEQPPPLPPSNDTSGNGGNKGKQAEKQKNLRFALENLETVLNPSRASSLEDHYQQQHSNCSTVVSAGPKKMLKKVTLSLPGEDSVSSRNHELLLNYEELNNCSSEILSCGHVRNDDYSTLSSLTSAHEISDFDDIDSQQGNNSSSGDMLGEVTSNNGLSSASGGESDLGSGSAGDSSSKNTKPIPKPNVLQQLRDLSRLISGNSSTKLSAPLPKTDRKASTSHNENNSFFLHNNGNDGKTSNRTPNNNNEANCQQDSDALKTRKTSDATDNSADSGKGSGSGTGSASGSGSSGQEGSSSSAEPSPNNPRGVPITKTNVNVSSVKIPTQSKRLKVATIRGRGGGTRSAHHYAMCADEHCQQAPTAADSSCSQPSPCSCRSCDYRSDCSECQRHVDTEVPSGFPKPSNSEELCSNETGRKKQIPPPPSKSSRPVVSKVVRRNSSRVRGSLAARRSASLRRASRMNYHASNNRKPVILDYCDCSKCDLACDEYEDFEDEEDSEGLPQRRSEGNDIYYVSRHIGPRRHHSRNPPPQRHYHEPLLIPVNLKGSKRGSSKCKSKGRPTLSTVGCSISSGSVSDRRKISSSSVSSGISSSSSAGGKHSRISVLKVPQPVNLPTHPIKSKSSQLLRQSDAAAGAALSSNPVLVGPSTPGNLFTIDEANEDSVYGEASGVGTAATGKGAKNGNSHVSRQQQDTPPSADFHLHPHAHHRHHRHNNLRDDESIDNNNDKNKVMTQITLCGSNNGNNNGDNNMRTTRSHQHSHPKCWLAPDATLGWSDLESLYSQNIRLDGKQPIPAALRDECPSCWKELSEMKKNCRDPTRTVDRTKRMFIWLNRRHKEFHAPWWEAKKQASMRWLVTKAFAHVMPKDKMPDPFKESKKGKPTKYSLRDDIVKGLVSGKLYCMALDSLYRSQHNNYHLNQNLSHWEIIKILSRRGIYIAQPSDMKLTEATLRQKKPIRTAAHIALIEAMMGLYAKEILGRDRIAATLRSFGKFIDPDTNSPERLVISWINTAVTTLKSYILSNAPQQLASNKVNRWLNLSDVGEIRDLCDGVGVCALFALYCSNDLKIEEISVPEPGDTLTIYDSITNHSLVQKLCEDLFPEPIYHLCVTDFLYIHGCMKQNILCFLVDLFVHLEINPPLRVNRLTHVPIRVEL